jgi:hypothetical protein
VFTGDYSVYKGKRVYLINFNNKATDTSIWYYYSLDKKFSYSKPLDFYPKDRKWGVTDNDANHNHFWYAFRDAFTRAGMLVSDEDKPDITAPVMWVTLLSITDVNYHVMVTVEKSGGTVTKDYNIQEPPLAEKDRNPAVLEERAYKMTNKLISTILEDPAFQKHLAEP